MLLRRHTFKIFLILIWSAIFLWWYTEQHGSIERVSSDHTTTIRNDASLADTTGCVPNIAADPSVDSSAKFYSVWKDSVKDVQKGEGITKKIVFWTKLWKKHLNVFMPGKEGKLCSTLPQCIFTTNAENLQNADAVVFENSQLPGTYIKSEMPLTRSPHQQWIWFISECPNYLTIDLNSYSGVFNWTITYRTDSDVSGAWGSLHMVYSRLKGADLDPNTDYSVGKTKLVVWFISKCSSRAQRILYAKELMEHIHVDIFGKCGRVVCEKQDFACTVQYIRQYKFYLAFENMKCKEYITEKFWRHALTNNVVPVVLGAPKKDYEYLTPPNSFIHVDDFESPKALAGYLKLLDTDTDMYNQYFKWKTNPPKSIPLDNGVWCNLCRKLIRICPDTRKMYTNLDKWYRGENNDQCVPLRNGTYHEVHFASDGDSL